MPVAFGGQANDGNGSQAATRGFERLTVELPFKLAGSTADVRESPDPTLC
jgi:hypothetical protein